MTQIPRYSCKPELNFQWFSWPNFTEIYPDTSNSSLTRTVFCFPSEFELPVVIISSLRQWLLTINMKETTVKSIKFLSISVVISLQTLLIIIQDYRIYSTISRDPKLWTCRLGITRTKNKSKTPGYKPRPIHYNKTGLLTTGKPNIFGKNHIDCHKWGR